MSATKLRGCFITVVGNIGKPVVDIKRWIETAGGIYQVNLTKDTTHLIASEDKWKALAAPVLKALQEEKVNVVSWDWLDDTLKAKTRKSEKKYWWETLDARTMKRHQLKVASSNKEAEKAIRAKNKKTEREAEKAVERERKKAVRERKKVEKERDKISYAAALASHTGSFMGPAERLASAEVRGRKKKENVVPDRSFSPSAATSKASKSFRKGAKAAKMDLLSANHHVYMDKTGFHYDVVLSKVDLTSNDNERHTLTIYESNSIPTTYALHLKSSGTHLETSASILCVMGTNFPTSFRRFKKEFHHFTGVDWDQRVEAFARLSKGFGGRGSTGDSGGGANRSSFSLEVMRVNRMGREIGLGAAGVTKAHVPFEDMPFVYRLPALGKPRGVMPPLAGEFDFAAPVMSIEHSHGGVQQQQVVGEGGVVDDDEEEEEEGEKEEE